MVTIHDTTHVHTRELIAAALVAIIDNGLAFLDRR
jgi:hypothetical protein